MPGIHQWLQTLGLEKYAPAFAANDIDLETLPLLGESDLASLGLTLGHRRRLQHALSNPDAPVPVAPQRLADAAAAPVSEAMDPGERRHLTVLFCDMVGFTELASRIDPELLQAIIQRYEDICAACVETYDGFVFQRLGDGIVAFFGYPIAHEDEAERAVRAGLDIIEALAGSDFPEAGHIAVRIGIASGMVVVQSAEQGAIGDTAVIAARLQSIAQPDTILVSGRIKKLTGDRIAYRDMGPQRLKGIAEPIPAFHALSLRSLENRFDSRRMAPLTPFVGRKAQLGRLRTCWASAMGGEGQVVGIGGEAGIGKSRLTRVIVDEARDEADAWVIESQCSPFHTHSGLYPFVESLGRLIFGDTAAGDAARWAAIKTFLQRTDLPLLEALPLLANQFSITPPAGEEQPSITAARARTMTRHYLIQLLIDQARTGPGILLVEDLHWADPSALELIELLSERVRDRPILVILTYRPEFDRVPTHEHTTVLSLSRLRGAAAAELVQHAFADGDFDAEVLRQVADKTDGVPLFIEEFARAVVDSRRASPASVGNVTIPDTLRDSLMGRLDRLGHAKSIAQLAAILGREFARDILDAVWQGSAEALETGLERLGEAGLIYPVGNTPQRRYAFKHALIQDAAYESLLKSHRIAEHRRIATIVEERFPDIATASPEVVAHHFSAGGHPHRATHFWLQAGQQSLRRNAHVEAIAHLEKALGAIESLPDGTDHGRTELDVHLTLGTALVVAKGYAFDAVGQAWTRAQALCAKVDDVDAQVRALFGLWLFRTVGADHQEGLALSRTLLDLAAASGSEDILIIGHQAMSVSSYFLGDFAEAEASCMALLGVYDAERHASHRFQYGQDPAAIATALLAWLQWLRGDSDTATVTAERAIADARRLDHPYSLSYTLAYAGWLHLYNGDIAGVEAIAATLIPLCTEARIPLFLSNGVMLVGWALCEQGDADGPAELARGLEMYRATGSRCFLPYRLALFAEAQSRRDEHEAALTLMREALALLEKTGERWCEPELHRINAAVLDRAGGDAAAVESSLRAAMESADARGTVAWHAAAATMLADLLRRLGRSDELPLPPFGLKDLSINIEPGVRHSAGQGRSLSAG